MGKANNPDNKSKPRLKVSILHLLLVLTGADLILLLAPEYGILNSIQPISDLYSWPALIGGIMLLILGFKGVYKKY
jgi:hypothetical protein